MAVAVSPASTSEGLDAMASPPRSSRDGLRRAAIVAVLIPFLVVIVRIWLQRGRPFVPFADYALLEMQLRDFGAHLPQLGAYSRFGWHHPGPMEAWLLEPLYLFTGRHALSMWIGGACINAAACVVVVVVAFRRLGRAGGVLATGVLGGYLVFLGPLGVSDPWNPIIGVLPFVALTTCLWDAWCGGRWTWITIVILASFVAQAHVQYATPAFLLSLATVVGVAVRYRRGLRDRIQRGRSIIAVGLGLALVLWLPPLAQQFTERNGNLGALFEYGTAGRGAQHAWWTSLQFALRELVAPITRFASDTSVISTWPEPAPVVASLAVVVIGFGSALAIRSRLTDLLGLYALGFAGVAIAVAQCTRMEGPLWPYLLLWISGCSVTFGIALVGTVLALMRRRRLLIVSNRVRLAVGGGALAVIALGVSAAMVVKSFAPMDGASLVQPMARTVAAQLPRTGPVLITDGGLPVMFQLTTLDGQLVRAGVDVRAPNSQRLIFGTRTIGTDVPVLTLQLYVIDPAQPAPDIPGATLYARAGTLALYRIA